ncbi:MAG: FkbM family methyltransferase, partial [bacterium]
MEKLKTVQRFPDLIYDVGMNIGEDTEFYLKKGFRVIAFEANSELVKQNQERFRKEIANNQLTIVEGAIVEDASSDTIKFYKNLDNSKWSTIDSNWTQRCEKLGTRNKIIEVNTIDYSKCIEKYGIPYYMKIVSIRPSASSLFGIRCL